MALFELVAGGLLMISFLYCFVFVDEKGKGYMAMGKRLLYKKIPAACKSAIEKVPGGSTLVWFLERSQRYICFEANPAIQFFYLALAVGGYYLYVVYGFQHVPNSYLDEYHKYVAWPFMGACYWSYYKACGTNPGYLKDTERSTLERAAKRYPYDDIMFSSKAWCDTCAIPKPARSKHCALCNMCCEKFDHHCVWINNCVGLHNYKYFVLFLVLHLGICLYGLVVGYFCALHLIDEGDLWNKVFYDRQGNKFRANWQIILQYLQSEYEMFSIVVFLCGIVTIMLFLFIAFHSYLIWKDMTTNEFSKRQMIQRFLEGRLSFLEKWEKARTDKKAFRPNKKAIEKHGISGDLSLDLSTEDLVERRELTKQ